MYFHLLLVVLALISAYRVGWQQSCDIVWYVDPISTADPETMLQFGSGLLGEPEEIRDHSVDPSSVLKANFVFYLSKFSLRFKY